MQGAASNTYDSLKKYGNLGPWMLVERKGRRATKTRKDNDGKVQGGTVSSS